MYEGERFNSITHLVGAVLALIGVTVLVTLAGVEGGATRIISFTVYGVTLFLLYLSSTLYHSLRGRAKEVFQVLDHHAIYLLIAGTYTPFTLVALRGSKTGWWLFGAVWGLALIGMITDTLRGGGGRLLSVCIYLLMGWLIVFALGDIIAALPPAGFAWLVAGGLFYTVGVAFYALDSRWPWCHGIWHLFVLAGSVSHYFAILLYL
ncbi:PAQR family membrane homeostasis protein TrhA [Candidatus Thiodictyon syntrophicum]|jgi:hemolysin III|uniref:Hemolysin III n=1 Tax=Candidatus Thiodictyon syntrophicum TaxID=1166950 RepID=A0A2K8U656_9GAMM|nr:hemolysin III family protein [Candidatus Thiodictyon syntrophicum]AUB81063.1 hemolysin III [Candidatus Thiodictyon syntrophicum]